MDSDTQNCNFMHSSLSYVGQFSHQLRQIQILGRLLRVTFSQVSTKCRKNLRMFRGNLVSPSSGWLNLFQMDVWVIEGTKCVYYLRTLQGWWHLSKQKFWWLAKNKKLVVLVIKASNQLYQNVENLCTRKHTAVLRNVTIYANEAQWFIYVPPG
jgi:hypothetical protein